MGFAWHFFLLFLLFGLRVDEGCEATLLCILCVICTGCTTTYLLLLIILFCNNILPIRHGTYVCMHLHTQPSSQPCTILTAVCTLSPVLSYPHLCYFRINCVCCVVRERPRDIKKGQHDEMGNSRRDANPHPPSPHPSSSLFQPHTPIQNIKSHFSRTTYYLLTWVRYSPKCTLSLTLYILLRLT